MPTILAYIKLCGRTTVLATVYVTTQMRTSFNVCGRTMKSDKQKKKTR